MLPPRRARHRQGRGAPLGTIEEQLKKWKQQAKPQQSSPPPSSSSPSSSPSRKAPTKKDPFPKQVLRKEAAPPPAKKKTDAELFAEAVNAVGADVVLEKFSAAPQKSGRREPAPPPLTDEELFERFLGEDNVAAEQDGGQKARLVRLKK